MATHENGRPPVTPRPWPAEADRLAQASVAAGDPTGWFDRLWSQARDGATTMPWNSREAHPLLVEWTAGVAAAARPTSAVVVGCGLGADAEHVGAWGVPTTAFDISAAAVDLVRSRYPNSPVDYRQADLFSVPPEWRRGFALVVDVYTVQALPRDVRSSTTRAVAELVAPGGTLVSIMAALDPDEDPGEGPPWPLTRTEIDAFAEYLDPVTVERRHADRAGGRMFWRAVFRRPPA